ncbi:MAG: hypothetical protein LQ343_003312 [Gyalolechia ehrenbergii]|nr:MAG: hypothetical protein LQ343_003312 [Gyalolechia ehrenbergii]
MAEFALAINILEAVKTTYRVATFVYETIKSAKHEDAEQQQIASDFGRELLFLASFRRYLEKTQGAIAYDKTLDELWLSEIEQIVSHMKQDFLEYEELARKDKPVSLESSTSSLSLPTKLNDIGTSSESKLDSRPDEKRTSMSQRWKDGQYRVYKKTKWALFDRQHLQSIVERFRKRNKALKRALQFAMAGILQQIAQHGQGLKSLQEDEDARALGLTTWAEIKQIKDQPENIERDFSIENCTVETVDDAAVVCLGVLSTRTQRSITAVWDKVRKDDVLVEYKTYPPTAQGMGNFDEQHLDARLDRRINQLASLLSTAGSNSLGTLPFRGFVKEPQHSRYAFLFNTPSGTNHTKPDSLHQMIESPILGRLWSLSDRFALAVNLAKVMGTFHMFEWVLKGFQSNSVIFCNEVSANKPQLRKPFLAGFEYIRPVSGSTVGQPLDMSEKTVLYCHPDLQEEPNLEFGKIHDLYSLGVVLLEIGLWTTARQLLQQARPPRPSAPREIREEYIRKANSKLPLRVGRSYTEAVVACLESRHKYQAIRPDDFLNVFDEEIVQKLSTKRLLD